MSDKAISPLRRRLIEDMAIRRLGPKTQHHYIGHVKRFADFLGQSADKATAEDVHRYQVWLASIGTTVPTVNVSATALRFFFKVTLKRRDLADAVVSVREPRRLPVVLSPEEVGRPREYNACPRSHAPAQLCHPSIGTKGRYPGHPGPARTQEARHDGALHPRRHQRDWRGDEPTRSPAEDARLSAAVAAVGGRGGGHLPSSRAGLACLPRRPCEPRPTEGDVGDRALPNGGVGRSCRTLRSLRPPAHLLQLLPQPALPEVPGCRCQGVARRSPGRTAARALFPRRLHPAGAERRHRLSQPGGHL